MSDRTELIADLRTAAEGNFAIIGEPGSLVAHRHLLGAAAAELEQSQADVSPSEALFAFMGWLTCRKKVSGPFSFIHDAAGAADLVRDFCLSQEFAEPRDGYTLRMKAYPDNLAPDVIVSRAPAPATKGPHAEVVIIDDPVTPEPGLTVEDAPKNPAPWPDPTPAMRDSPIFEAIWQTIKRWDVNVPDVYAGYCGATGNHVRAILDALPSRAVELDGPLWTEYLDIVIDGPPGPEAGRFVEVENDQGKSVSVGNWTKRDGVYWALRLRVADQSARAPEPPERKPAPPLKHQLCVTADRLWAKHGPATDEPHPGRAITVGILRQLAFTLEDLEAQAVRRLEELGVELPLVDDSPHRMPLSEECRRSAARDETSQSTAAGLVLMADMLEGLERRARELLRMVS
jgi:hypothetical protein